MQTHKSNNLHLGHAQWLRADFHLHTRADKEFKYSGDENGFVAAYVDALAEADICTCDVLYIDVSGRLIKEHRNNPKAFYQNNDYLMSQWYISNFMWDKLFKSNVFKTKRFDVSLSTNEDVHFLFSLLYEKKIVSAPFFLYNYLQRPAATSKSAPPTFIQDRIKIVNKQIAFAKEIGRFDSDKKYLLVVYLKHFLFNVIATLSRYSLDFNSDIKKLKKEIDYRQFTFKNIGHLEKLAIIC